MSTLHIKPIYDEELYRKAARQLAPEHWVHHDAAVNAGAKGTIMGRWTEGAYVMVAVFVPNALVEQLFPEDFPVRTSEGGEAIGPGADQPGEVVDEG